MVSSEQETDFHVWKNTVAGSGPR